MDHKAAETCNCESCVGLPDSEDIDVASLDDDDNKWLQRMIHAAEIAGGFSIDYLMMLGLEQPVELWSGFWGDGNV
jgi:hypothetical protein